MSQRRTSALAAALLTLVTASAAQVMATGAAEAAPGVRKNTTSCVRPGQTTYPVNYYWKNVVGMQLGSGNVAVDTTPALWGGQIAPGSTFTLRLAHRTARWPLIVRSYTTSWDLSSLLANADIVSQSGAGTISGTTLTIPSSGTKTDPAPKVITFRVKQGTAGRSMTMRPTGISSIVAFPGQLGDNTPAPPIQIVNGQTISPTVAVNDTATTRQDTAVTIPVPANDTGSGTTITAVGKPANGTVAISGNSVVYTPPTGLSGTDTFTYTISTPCGTSTATVTVVVTCVTNPITLANGSFESPYVATANWNIPDASTNPAAGWRTTASDGMLEIWRSGFQGVPSADGQQFAELNASEPSTLYQDVPTVPGTVMTWSIWHRGRAGTDVMQVLIGAPGATVAQTPTGATSPNIATDNTAWRQYSGTYVVPAGQTVTRFSFQAVSSAGGGAFGNFLDGVVFQTPPCQPMQ
ncbi:Ig-like domain-containing protein [Acrocarpospora catenulata]|uniref:Ig-like domain-containing protein n=1 Tax=Acrocarpospora catenulata TaxID=2836182 RepID=UPI001BD9D974|nr:Ig-like domain-containing protein [Acrocarpospora catenulata]